MKFLQRYRVLQLAIQRKGLGFSRWDAANEVGCFELASRIGELEAEGVEFTRRRYTALNRYGDRVRGVTYDLHYCPPVIAAHIATLRMTRPYPNADRTAP